MKETELSFNIDPIKLIEALQKSKVTDSGRIHIDFSRVEDFRIHGECNSVVSDKLITPDDYYRFDELIKEYGINLKDIREVIALAYSWWVAERTDPWANEKLILKYHIVHKKEALEKVYSEELLMATLKALSSCKDPISDFYSRIKRTPSGMYDVFEEFYKKMYDDQ